MCGSSFPKGTWESSWILRARPLRAMCQLTCDDGYAGTLLSVRECIQLHSECVDSYEVCFSVHVDGNKISNRRIHL